MTFQDFYSARHGIWPPWPPAGQGERVEDTIARVLDTVGDYVTAACLPPQPAAEVEAAEPAPDPEPPEPLFFVTAWQADGQVWSRTDPLSALGAEDVRALWAAHTEVTKVEVTEAVS